MKLLRSVEPESIRSAIQDEDRCDYVYSYPPRQAYRAFDDPEFAENTKRDDLKSLSSYNLYVHVPFCQQICNFCNLYTTPSRHPEAHDTYVSMVIREADSLEQELSDKKVRTLYVGGGTPSLLQPDLLARLLSHLVKVFNFDILGLPEVALEVAPETVTAQKLVQMKEMGFNRINLGAQSLSSSELLQIGRRTSRDVLINQVAVAQAVGFANVCVDLIYGFRGQSLETWSQSVREVVSLRPQTVCAYPLTLRSGTGFHHKGFTELDGAEQYRKYDIANSLLQEAGYEQQTHVRWAIPGIGGYLQKEYHWASEPLVGLGAGARSYLPSLDVRNGYSLGNRGKALRDYSDHLSRSMSPVTDGFEMDADERRRKALVLGLNRLDRQAFASTYGVDPWEQFSREFELLLDLGLITSENGVIQLTPLGLRHRDVAVQVFISEKVRGLVLGHRYDD